MGVEKELKVYVLTNNRPGGNAPIITQMIAKGFLDEIIKDYHEAAVSGAGELPPCALSEPDLNLSAHPAPVIQPLVSFPIANAETARAAYGLFAPTSIPPWSDGVSTF